ncbi:unnamed protein product [Mesocestoides corti]|uniref:PDZ domain-containing protein n=1 Tax=Mesocestoides corti TaxID=53468 RepID=A0A158QT91_MESCO|nr:unnamed protein product [Mesocestoides corti]
MGDADYAQNPHDSQFSKFVNEVTAEEFVEIPLFSDAEHDGEDVCPNLARIDPQPSLVEVECIYPPHSESRPESQIYCESPKSVISDSQSAFNDANCLNLDNEEVGEDLKLNEGLAYEMQYQCTLLSPSLVRAITSDIEEIKRSLAKANASNNTMPDLLPKQGTGALPTVSPIKGTLHSKQIINDKISNERDVLFKFQRSTKLSGARKRHENSRSGFSKRIIHLPTKAKMLKSNGQLNGSKSERLTTRQWTFPAAANTVYSSSENPSDSEGGDVEGPSPSCSSSVVTAAPTKSDDCEGVKIETHDGEWSLQRKPPLNGTPQAAVSDSQACGPPLQLQHPRRHKQPQTCEPDYGSDEDTDQLLGKQYQSDKPVEIPELKQEAEYLSVKQRRGREVAVHHPDFPDRLIEGRLYHSRYLGSTQLLCESHPSKINRLHQAQEAVNRVKEIVMDHDLRFISYIADIGSILVLMVRRRRPSTPPAARSAPPTDSPCGQPESTNVANGGVNSEALDTIQDQLTHLPPKITCHLFESDETQMIAQAIGKAFQEAYFEFLRQNGVEDPEAFQERSYQNILNQQEIFQNELAFFSDRDQEKEVIVPKQKGETLGVVIVESGWGSVLPTAVLANMHPAGPAARCGQLNIGNQIISINGRSLVGLPLASAQALIKATKNQTSVKLVIVNCSPVVEVLIRRPDHKFQLGFSVQDGVICSLLRGGIAERGGIRVDHRIIEINGESVVAVPHEYIVQLLANAVGEIYIRTMPTSIFRLLTGQDTPHYI